jgi:hypothetical protein
VVFAHADRIIGAQGNNEQLLAILQPDLEVSGQLAAWAIWWGMMGGEIIRLPTAG